VNGKNPSPGQQKDNKTNSEIRKYFLKYAHSQLYMRISFKLFLIINVDKITPRITVNLEPCSAKLKNKGMLSIRCFCFFS